MPGEFQSTLSAFVFHSSLAVDVIKIDSSKKRTQVGLSYELQLGFELYSLCAIGRRNKTLVP